MGKQYGGAVDWWQLGVLVYQMLYGAVPFEVTAKVPAAHLRKGVVYEVQLLYRYEHDLRLDTVGRLAFATGDYVYDDSVKSLLVARKRFSLPNTPARSPGRLVTGREPLPQ